MKKFGRKRHIAKTITWRLVATIDTILLSWIISGNVKIGVAIGGAEVLSKMLLYYMHERIWYHMHIFKTKTSRPRHILKTITWRLIGTMDTMIIGWVISGDKKIHLKYNYTFY